MALAHFQFEIEKFKGEIVAVGLNVLNLSKKPINENDNSRFQSSRYPVYCLLNLATQKKFESEISCATVKFKRSRLQNRNLSRLRSHYLSKSDFADKFTDFKFIKRSFVKTSVCALF